MYSQQAQNTGGLLIPNPSFPFTSFIPPLLSLLEGEGEEGGRERWKGGGEEERWGGGGERGGGEGVWVGVGVGVGVGGEEERRFGEVDWGFGLTSLVLMGLEMLLLFLTISLFVRFVFWCCVVWWEWWWWWWWWWWCCCCCCCVWC